MDIPETTTEPSAVDALWDDWYNDPDIGAVGRVLVRHFRPLLDAAYKADLASPTQNALDASAIEEAMRGGYVAEIPADIIADRLHHILAARGQTHD